MSNSSVAGFVPPWYWIVKFWCIRWLQVTYAALFPLQPCVVTQQRHVNTWQKTTKKKPVYWVRLDDTLEIVSQRVNNLYAILRKVHNCIRQYRDRYGMDQNQFEMYVRRRELHTSVQKGRLTTHTAYHWVSLCLPSHRHGSEYRCDTNVCHILTCLKYLAVVYCLMMVTLSPKHVVGIEIVPLCTVCAYVGVVNKSQNRDL